MCDKRYSPYGEKDVRVGRTFAMKGVLREGPERSTLMKKRNKHRTDVVKRKNIRYHVSPCCFRTVNTVKCSTVLVTVVYPKESNLKHIYCDRFSSRNRTLKYFFYFYNQRNLIKTLLYPIPINLLLTWVRYFTLGTPQSSVLMNIYS